MATNNALRLRTNFVSGTITDNPLLVGATTLNSAGLAALPVVDSAHHVALTLDPNGSGGSPEVVWVTAHTVSATSATILRAQEGTSARQHISGIPWINAPTKLDFTPPYLGETGINDRVWNRPTTTAHALDDEFNDGSLDSSWLTYNQAGAPTVVATEAADVLSLNHPGNDATAGVLSHIWAKALGGLGAPLTIEAGFRMFRRYAINYQMFGLCMTDGLAATNKAVWNMPYSSTGTAAAATISTRTWAALGTAVQTTIGTDTTWEWPSGLFYQRLRWTAANTFQSLYSPDGVSWMTLPTGTFAFTMTPTHVGFAMSTWGGANACIGSVEYFRVTAV